MPYKRIPVIGAVTALLFLSTLAYASATALGPSPARSLPNQAAPTATACMNYLPMIGKKMGNLSLAPLWRFGVARARRAISDYEPTDIAAMRFGWYVDWGAGSSALAYLGIEYVPMVRVKQMKLNGSTPTSAPCGDCPYATPHSYAVSPAISQIQAMASSRPGLLWVIGNEIERRDWGTCSNCGQDEILPELYAVAYHEVYTAIKSADPTAQVAIGGVIQATPLRLAYLQRVWDAYATAYGGDMPVDVWNVHAFVLNEQSTGWGAGIPAGMTETAGMVITPEQNKDFSIARGHIIALRTWMQQHGQRNKPLIITEYGVNIPASWCYWPGNCPFTADKVRNSFMYPSFNFFLNGTDASTGFPADGNRLVQRWNWYSLDDDSVDPSTGQQAYNGNLFWSGLETSPQGVAPLGTYWKQYVQSLPPGASKPY